MTKDQIKTVLEIAFGYNRITMSWVIVLGLVLVSIGLISSTGSIDIEYLEYILSFSLFGIEIKIVIISLVLVFLGLFLIYSAIKSAILNDEKWKKTKKL